MEIGETLYPLDRSAFRTWLAEHYQDQPSLAEAAPAWVALGAKIVGGCCRTGPREIRALRRRLIAPADATRMV